MKKMLIAGIVFSSLTASAATSGTLLIQGIVTAVLNITITPNSNATSLNITAGEANKLVAAVSEQSNNLTGYKINMKSANASKLVHGTDSTKQTGYTISYNGGSPVTLTTTDQQVKNVSSLSALTTASSNVNINVTALPNAVAGTNSDTVTISIVSN